MIIRARAPLRLGLAGGGTDVSPYCDIYGGCVLNGTINRYAYAIIKILEKPVVKFIASDYHKENLNLLDFPLKLDGNFDLHKSVYNEIMMHYHNGEPLSIELTTFCDAPAGSGLGSSSTLVVAMIKAFTELLNLPLDEYAIARMAYKVERVTCGLQGGRQDQYSSTFGGFNFMEFNANDLAMINPLHLKNWVVCELEASLLLFYTGLSRASAKIIADQSDHIKAGQLGAIEAMHGMKEEALQMKEYLLQGDFDGIVRSMRQGWDHKKRSATTVSTPYIDQIYETAINAGSLAGKVSGAGGGGFMMFFVPPTNRMNVIKALSQFNQQIDNCHFTRNGSQAWRID